MVTKIITQDKSRLFTVGERHIIYNNVEDIASYRIFIIDDIYETVPGEDTLEISRIKFEYKGKISKFIN